MTDLQRQHQLVWACFGITLLGTILTQISGWEWPLQQRPEVRNWTGGLLLAALLAQWTLSIGRIVYKAQGARWDVWVEVHQWLAWLVPMSMLSHSLHLGYGMLAVLPLTMFGAMLAGLWVSLKADGRKWLPYHLVLSAMSLAGSLVHLWRVVCYR